MNDENTAQITSESAASIDAGAPVTEAGLRAEIAELEAYKEQRLAGVPKAPGGYELRLPAEFTPPPGFEVPETGIKLNPDDRRYRLASEYCHENMIPQAGFERLISMAVHEEMVDDVIFRDLKAAELQKLGANGAERLDAAKAWLNERIGPALAASFNNVLFREKQVHAIERLRDLFRQASPDRQPTPDPDPSDDQWDKMSDADRVNHARQSGA